jgi:putative copper export protein
MGRVLVVWLHVLAASAWVGGLLYGSHLVLPQVARGERGYARLLTRARPIAWTAIGVLVLTGIENLRHVRADAWVMAKVLLVLVLVPLAAHRDFALLPGAVRALEGGEPPDRALGGLPWVDRALVLGAVVLVFLGVAVARVR